jgi:hypothetical protein
MTNIKKSFREDMVKDEDKSCTPTTSAGVGYPIRDKARHSSPQMLPSYASNSCPAVSSDLVKAYHMGRPGVQIVSEP